MFARIRLSAMILAVLLVCSVSRGIAQKKGAESITAAELKRHLTFIASDELQGRNAPSPWLKVAARYLATQVESYGFRPVMPDGSFFQTIDLPITTIDEVYTRITIKTAYGEEIFTFPQAFNVRSRTPGIYSGDVLFLGYGPTNPDESWNDYTEADLKDRIIVVLDGKLSRKAEFTRIVSLRESGAAGLLTVINSDREGEMERRGLSFDNIPVGIFPESEDSSPPAQSPFLVGDVRQDVGTALLGISRTELLDMFSMPVDSGWIPPQDVSGTRIDVTVGVKTVRGHTQNVVALLDGADSRLRKEYVVFGAHYDHVGAREGKIWNGADDDGSGTVSLLEIAQAMSVDRPKRSVIIVWHTGEEKGLRGSNYFTKNPPVPLEKISAAINMDMIGRNDPNTLFVIGAGRISAELDKITRNMNEKYVKMNLDYTFDDPNDPNRFYYRSDHYMYARFGIPIVFFFTNVHDDYHQPTDTVEKINFTKMERISKLAYYVGHAVADSRTLLELDADSTITVRGTLYPQSKRK